MLSLTKLSQTHNLYKADIECEHEDYGEYCILAVAKDAAADDSDFFLEELVEKAEKWCAGPCVGDEYVDATGEVSHPEITMVVCIDAEGEITDYADEV